MFIIFAAFASWGVALLASRLRGRSMRRWGFGLFSILMLGSAAHGAYIQAGGGSGGSGYAWLAVATIAAILILFTLPKTEQLDVSQQSEEIRMTQEKGSDTEVDTRTIGTDARQPDVSIQSDGPRKVEKKGSGLETYLGIVFAICLLVFGAIKFWNWVPTKSDGAVPATSEASPSESLGFLSRLKIESVAVQLIKEQSQTPSSFKSVSNKVVWQGKYEGRDAYIVRAEFDMQNAFGALLRGCQYVSFSLQGDKISFDRLYYFFECPVSRDSEIEPIVISAQKKFNFKILDADAKKSDSDEKAPVLVTPPASATNSQAASPADTAAIGETSTLPKFEKDESYSSVRKKMIGATWTPHHADDADECSKFDTRCAGRPEMYSCAGTGRANCKFLWKQNEKIAAICTVGETEPTFAGMCAYP